MQYEVQAIRSGDWWAIEIPGIAEGRIHTQAKRLEQVPDAAAAAITDWYADEDGRKVRGTDIVMSMTVPGLQDLFDRARHTRNDAEQAADDARRSLDEAIAAGRAAGLSLRDIGSLLGVSHQYLSRVAAA